MEQEERNNTRSKMEAQLQWLIKALTDTSNTATKEMRNSAQEGFVEVRTKLDYVYDAILRREPESVTVQDYAPISTGTQVRNVQIPSTAIDVG